MTETVSLFDLISSPMFYIPVLALCLTSLTAVIVKHQLDS